MSKHIPNDSKGALNSLLDEFIDAARQDGQVGAKRFIDVGGFDLLAYVRSFELNWQARIFHPTVSRRLYRWRMSIEKSGPLHASDWAELELMEEELSIVEFGRNRFSYVERVRLRLIRQAHGLTWQGFLNLLNTFAANVSDGTLSLRQPSMRLTMALSTVQILWLIVCGGLLVRATLRFLMMGCITCDVLGTYLLIPYMVTVSALLYIFGDAWRNSWRKLNTMLSFSPIASAA
jgi:hypothetical protein